MLDSHLETPPTSDHQSGGEDSERSELTSLTERLNKTRELTRVINMKLESTGHVSIGRSLDRYRPNGPAILVITIRGS